MGGLKTGQGTMKPAHAAIAEETKKGCPVGKALAAVPIRLSARLAG